MDEDKRIIIRNLTSLKTDMVSELRQTLAIVTAWRRADPPPSPEFQHEVLTRIDRKLRNVMEYLTGDRE